MSKNHPPPQTQCATKPTVFFDVEYFDRILNRPDIPNDKREAALDELWQLIGMIIDVGWGAYPMPDSMKTSGQSVSSLTASPPAGADMVYSERQQFIESFIEASSLDQTLEGETP